MPQHIAMRVQHQYGNPIQSPTLAAQCHHHDQSNPLRNLPGELHPIMHIFWAGTRNRPSRWTGLALAAALGESAVFVVNRGRCPLTTLVEYLGAESGRVSDIFLPRWFADRIPQLCTPPLVIGVLGLLRNRWHRSGQSRPPV